MSEREIEIYRCLTELRRPLIERVIRSLAPGPQSNGLDAGCGNGGVTRILADAVGLADGRNQLVGLDISAAAIEYARRHHTGGSVRFIEGDICALPFGAEQFDWVWSMDAVWPGGPEHGCPTDTPVTIIADCYRVLRSGGRVFILFWSGQRLLPGYPLLETRLNTSPSANAPFRPGMAPTQHMLAAMDWLTRAGFVEVTGRTFVGDLCAPLSQNDKDAVRFLVEMLWDTSQPEIVAEDADQLVRLVGNGGGSLLDTGYYYGFYSYTLFSGTKL